MKTVNISLTGDQLKNVDEFTTRFGFANRSEFFRAILRLVIRKPEVIVDADSYLFTAPDTKKATDIIADFKATKKYSTGFLKDLEKGLKESKYFNNES